MLPYNKSDKDIAKALHISHVTLVLFLDYELFSFIVAITVLVKKYFQISTINFFSLWIELHPCTARFLCVFPNPG